MNENVISGYLDKLIIPFNTNVNLFALNRDIIAHPTLKELAARNNYKLKVYGRYFPENSKLVVSIYYAKQTCVKAAITNFICQSYRYCLSEIIDQIENQLYSEYEYGCNSKEKIPISDIISNCLLEEEPIMTKKSKQEIEYEQFATNKEAELKVRTQEIQHEIDSQIEQKRLECQEDMKRQQQYEIAANYWYFYQGLMEAGFNEDQAMKILLNKMPGYVSPITCNI